MRDNKWVHPTGKSPERICILGLGPTSQDWHAAHVQYTPPIEQVDEVWTVNKGFRTVKADMVFIMDDLVDEARKSPRYGKEIALAEIPVITSTTDTEVLCKWPMVHKYPLAEVLQFWGRHIYSGRAEGQLDDDAALKYGLQECAYFNNSIPYMLAYAGMIGVKSICLFGCDYTFPGSAAREDDRANAEYWLSALQFGLSVAFTFPARTTILNRNQPRTFYGFNGRQPF